MTLEELARRIKSRPAPAGFEDISAMLLRQIDLLTTPLDLPGLVKDGKLRRLSATRYRLLVKQDELPEHVLARAVGVERDDAGTVLRFPPRQLCPTGRLPRKATGRESAPQD
jgi:hypothetical protein